jgi:hydroxyethylthiazole kinase-like uncharacterized protein yjeF
MATPTETRVLTPAALREWALPSPSGGGKESRGSVLVVGGSRRTPGAVLLAGLAALRTGAGRLTLAAGESAATTLAVAVPEAAVVGLAETPDGAVSRTAGETLGDLLAEPRAVLIGPGLQDPDETAAALPGLLERVGAETQVVLDAYALGCLPRVRDAARPLAGRLVLTPNATEAAFLLERDEVGDLTQAARAVADRYGAVVSLRGHVADPEGRSWVDESGHIGLGTSGSGDVLAGVVAGLLARGAEPAQAACWGSHVHATAGERLAARVGRIGFLARELLDEVPRVITELQP